MMTAVCVFLPVAAGIAIGEVIRRKYPEQMDKLLERVCGK